VTALSAAAASVEVTPPAGTPLAGYGARGDAVATGCHDPLEAGLFWLHSDTGTDDTGTDDTGTDVVWVTLDVVGVDVDLARTVSAAVAGALGRPDAVVLLCASHTHSSAAYWFHRPAGPAAFGAEDRAASEPLRARLVDRIAAAAAALPERLAPVRLLAAEGTVQGVGANRHRPDGPHDQSVGVLAAVDGVGDVVAALVNYASHPTVLGHDNLQWSADWPGATRRTLSGALHGLRPSGDPSGDPSDDHAPPVLFLQGAAGDSSARFVRRGQTFDEAARLGGLLAAQSLTALLEGAAEIDGPVAVRRAAVTLPSKRTPPPEVAREREEQAFQEWEAVRHTDRDGSPAERLARTRYEGARVDRAMAETTLPATFELPLTVVAVGRHAWVHLPVELFASFGLRIRAGSPFEATRVVGYTDGYFGYVADEAAHRDGVYEAGVSLVDAEAGDRLCAAALELAEATARAAAGAPR
jgi:hypothetical protein